MLSNQFKSLSMSDLSVFTYNSTSNKNEEKSESSHFDLNQSGEKKMYIDAKNLKLKVESNVHLPKYETIQRENRMISNSTRDGNVDKWANDQLSRRNNIIGNVNTHFDKRNEQIHL